MDSDRNGSSPLPGGPAYTGWAIVAGGNVIDFDDYPLGLIFMISLAVILVSMESAAR